MRLFKVSVLTQMSLGGFGEVDRWLSFHMCRPSVEAVLSTILALRISLSFE